MASEAKVAQIDAVPPRTVRSRYNPSVVLIYQGNVPYCYANAVSMLLSSMGETVSPSRIEPLTGMGLGAQWRPQENIIFFDLGPPDLGINMALDLLGYTYDEHAYAADAALPLDDLRTTLANGPAVIGPLDMGCLSYIPGHKFMHGSDHYVLALAVENAALRVHDPAGYPHALLPHDDLECAWRAEAIAYRRGAFRYWTSPARRTHPTDQEIFDEALAGFRALYTNARQGNASALASASAIGAEAILAAANVIAVDDPPMALILHLEAFALRLGGRRALDLAEFFRGGNDTLANIKDEQAQLFGRAHTDVARRDYTALAATLRTLAEIEEEFESVLTA